MLVFLNDILDILLKFFEKATSAIKLSHLVFFIIFFYSLQNQDPFGAILMFTRASQAIIGSKHGLLRMQ